MDSLASGATMAEFLTEEFRARRHSKSICLQLLVLKGLMHKRIVGKIHTDNVAHKVKKLKLQILEKGIDRNLH